ncbi:unnamed protein product [Calypogeia fissa]
MAFVAFGRKKVSNAQQQPEGSKTSMPNPPEDVSSSMTPQQSIETQGNEIEGFKILEDVEMDNAGLIAIGVTEHEATEHFPKVSFCESPTLGNRPKRGLLESDGGEGIPKFFEHNAALRRNFDDLKVLHVQLAMANTQLQEAFCKLQEDKEKAEKGLKRFGIMHELEQKNQSLEKTMEIIIGENKDLIQKLESSRMEKEKVLMEKHTAELEYTRELSSVKVDDQTSSKQATDLAHKCKHLEIELEKAIAAGDKVHQQLISLTFEKDSTIMDLEQALQRVREDLQGAERRHRSIESDWQIERKRLQAIIDEMERQEDTFKSTIKEEANQKLKEASKEIFELHATLVALEKPRADAEILHLETMRELTKEKEVLRKELVTALAAQKEASDCLTEMEDMRVQLSTALAQNQESFNKIADFRKVREEFEESIRTLKCQLDELGAIRDREHVEHAHKWEDAQRKWAADKSAMLLRTENVVKDLRKDHSCKSHSLKKKLKQTQKSLAMMTLGHNQMIVRLRECEAQLAIAQSTRDKKVRMFVSRLIFIFVFSIA